MKSFHDKAGFVDFPESAGQKDRDFSARPLSHERFQYGILFWEWIQSDPQLKEEIEIRMAERVNARIETMRRHLEDSAVISITKAQEEAKKAGYAEGLKAGQKAGMELALSERRPELEGALKRLSEIAGSVLAEKERVLRSHEAAWLEALEFILINCMVPREKEIIARVREWLENQLHEFGQSMVVTLAISPDRFESFRSALSDAGVPALRLLMDSSLSSGDFRVDCDNGGILFSDREAIEKLREAVRMIVESR